MLVILVRLYGDGSQGGIALDALRLAEESVASRKAPMEQLQDVYLTACLREGVEIKIQDMFISDYIIISVPGDARRFGDADARTIYGVPAVSLLYSLLPLTRCFR